MGNYARNNHPCSNAFCEAINACNASQPFHLGVTFTCIGKGELTVTITTTYNVNIAGVTSLDFFVSPTDPTLSPSIITTKFASEIIPGIEAGITYTTSFNAPSGMGTTEYIIATDSHSNYSNMVPVVIPSC